jgi:PPOX class probable F420-dependent enzyme
MMGVVQHLVVRSAQGIDVVAVNYGKTMATLSPEVTEFVSHGTRTGMLGYLASDGRPLVAPVWFIFEKGLLIFNTASGTAKARALQRDPRVVLTVDDPHPPYSFVQVQGVADFDENSDSLLDIATRIAARYMGTARADEFGRRNAGPDELIVRITPTKVVKSFNITH